MRPLLAVVTLLALRGPPTPPPGEIAVVLDTSIRAHVTLSASIQRASPWRVIERSPNEPWVEARAPVAVVTIGDEAHAWADREAPSVPHATLLRWVPTNPEELRRPTFHGSAHTQVACTIDEVGQAMERTGPVARRFVWSSPSDAAASDIARASEAQLVTGDLAALARALETGADLSTSIFVRATPAMVLDQGLERLGLLARASNYHIGSDQPGTQRYGITPWVRADLVAHGREVARWIERTLRPKRRRRTRTRGNTPPLTQSELPCLSE